MNMRFPLLPAALGLALAATTPALAQSDQGDPPSRVGRLAEASGTVSFHTGDENQWQPATVNYPVTSGNSFWADQRSHAAIDIGGGRLYLDSETELDIGTVGDQSFVAQIPQGAVYLRAPDASPGNQYEIDTPRGAVHISQPGQYEVIAGDNDRPTQVVVYQGAAQMEGPGVNMALAQGQAANITGQDQFQAQTIAAPPPDDFLRFVQSEEQPYQQQATQPAPTAQYVSPQETGYQDLSQYGSWSQTPDYGAVWYPQVEAGWAPYRAGHWAYVAPWGWTWIDDARWGFTPFHYGRWAQYHSRWCWIPGTVVARPVYAPALVTFFGNIGGLGVGVAIGGGNVGWVPLGPQEVYVPWYQHGPRYLQNVNITNVRNVTVINNTIINNYNSYNIDHFHNHAAATLVSADAMTHSRPIAAAFRQTPQNASQWGKVKPMVGAGRVIKPTYNTVGVSPKVAQRIGITPPAGGNFPAHHAPGPQMRVAQNSGKLPTFNKPGNKPGTPPAPGQNRPQNSPPKNGTGQNLPNLHTGGAPGPAVHPNQNKNLPQLHNDNGGKLPTIYHGNQSGTPGGGTFKPNQPQSKPQNGNGQPQQHNNQPQFKPQNGNAEPQHHNNQPQFKPQNGNAEAQHHNNQPQFKAQNGNAEAQHHNNEPQHNNQQHKPECKKPNGQPC